MVLRFSFVLIDIFVQESCWTTGVWFFINLENMKTMFSQFKTRWNVVLLLLVLFSTASGYSADTTKYKTRYVIVMVMDGPRWTETWGDSTHQYIPHMANDMAQHGVIYTNFRNNGPTYTAAGHTAITTGIYQGIKNNGLEFPKNPSMFQYWLKATSKARNAAYVIASKDKLAILTDCRNKKWKGKYRPYSDCGVNGLYTGYRGDDVTYKNSIRQNPGSGRSSGKVMRETLHCL